MKHRLKVFKDDRSHELTYECCHCGVKFYILTSTLFVNRFAESRVQMPQEWMQCPGKEK